ncbi:hypothetical protein ACIA98_38080 [Streptomyces sp. NPDC051366]|uniref:hypothetical protein n=1 Tax=Streptomyces sp. NPDC051366 TaxID=3365652 RepID=UPI00379DDE82
MKDGVDAKSDVRLGTPSKDADGHSSVRVTVSNTATSKKSFAVQADVRDTGGNLLDSSGPHPRSPPWFSGRRTA